MTRPVRLGREDARILGLERGSVHGHTCKVLVLGGELAPGAVRAQVERRIGAVPALRRRLAPTPLRLAPPAWVDDPGFDVGWHVREAAAHEGLAATVGGLMAEGLDLSRPPWAIELLALEGGRTALVWRLHHALADGATAVRMAEALLLDDAPQGDTPAAGARPVARAPGRAALLAQGVADRARGAGTAVRAALSPAAWRAAVRIPAVLRRELAGSAPETLLARPAGRSREVAFAAARLDELKRIGHAAPDRATVNDVVLAAVGGALRGWLGRRGAAVGEIRVQVPVSLHARAADAANRDSFICVDVPLEHDDPVERLAAVARETRERKQRHDAETLDAFFRDLSHLSRSLDRHAEAWAASPRVFTLNVSDVPGPSGPRWVMGSPLLELHTVAEIAHRHALRVAVISASGRVSFGLCADPAAVDGSGRSPRASRPSSPRCRGRLRRAASGVVILRARWMSALSRSA
jgi:diacylglycerol O-acyltransferase / wax synthase